MNKLRKKNYSVLSGPVNLKQLIIQNYQMILILIVFALGIIYSLLSYQTAHSGTSSLLSILAKQYEIKATQTFLDCFYNALINNGIYFLVVFLFGLCAIGLPVLIFVPFVYGMTAGFQVTYLYMTYQGKGIGYAALMVLPMAVIFGVILLLASEQGIRMSWDILSAIQDGRRPRITITVYLKRFFIFALATVFVTALLSLLNTGFAKIIVL